MSTMWNSAAKSHTYNVSSLICDHTRHPRAHAAWSFALSSLFIFPVYSIYLFLSSLMMLHPWLFLRALTINSFLFLLLHHASVSMRLNLASPCMGNRPRVATLQLKIDLQVEYKALPSRSLHHRAADSSLHSWIFMAMFLFEADAELKLDHRSKYRPRLFLTALSFPVFLSSSLTWLLWVHCREVSKASSLGDDAGLFDSLWTHRHNTILFLHCTSMPAVISNSTIIMFCLCFILIKNTAMIHTVAWKPRVAIAMVTTDPIS